MSIVAVHGPYTFGSKAVTEVGPAMATASPTNGLIWTFSLDSPSTRTASLAWTFPTGTPASATGPGPHTVTFASAGTKAVTAVATGVGEGANPYPPAGTTNLPVTAVAGAGPTSGLLMAPGGDDEPQAQARSIEAAPEEDTPDIDVGYDPAAHTVAEVEEFVAEHPEQLREMYDAEVAGKNRTTLVNHLESLLPFDPAEYSVEDVKAYVEDNPDEAIDVLNQERQGKNRSTLVSFLEDLSTVE